MTPNTKTAEEESKILMALRLAKECTYADAMTEGAKDYLREAIDDALKVIESPTPSPTVEEKQNSEKERFIEFHLGVMKQGLIEEGDKKWDEGYLPKIRAVAETYYNTTYRTVPPSPIDKEKPDFELLRHFADLLGKYDISFLSIEKQREIQKDLIALQSRNLELEEKLSQYKTGLDIITKNYKNTISGLESELTQAREEIVKLKSL